MKGVLDRHERLMGFGHRVYRAEDAAGAAVAAAAGGQAERHGAAVERAAAVAGLGADGGADQAGDGALGVVDGRVERGDPCRSGCRWCCRGG